MINDFRIEKSRLPVVLVTVVGAKQAAAGRKDVVRD